MSTGYKVGNFVYDADIYDGLNISIHSRDKGNNIPGKE